MKPYPQLLQQSGTWSVRVAVPFLGVVTLTAQQPSEDGARLYGAFEASNRQVAATVTDEREFWLDVQLALKTARHDKALCECDSCEGFRDEMRADGELEREGTGARDYFDA